MRVFNINKAIGLASSGVEYAQTYRRAILAEIAWVDDFYVFTDYMPTNLSVFTDRLGFTREQVLWIYNLLAGRQTQPCTMSVEQFVSTIRQPHDVLALSEDVTEVALTDSAVRYRIRTLAPQMSGQYVDRVETLVGDQLVRVEHYDQTLNNVEHFHENRLVRRVFHTADGDVAAEQFYETGPQPRAEISRTVITPASPLYERAVRRGRPSSFRGDIVLEGRSSFFQFVFARLFTRSDDVVIVDRALDVIDAVYPVIGQRRLYSVVHAEHYDLKQVEDGVLLWNNHYEHVFTRPEMIDGFIVSTQRQKDVLESQLGSQHATVARIPVGFAAQPAAPPQYDPLALVTAGRLADEKRLDLLIRAVAAARARVPGLRLDIYGEGNRATVIAAIEEASAHDWVRLMGHQQLDGVLGTYGIYVSASTSEGFGLSLLEAMAEGLPIVGFDVDYGNREMVAPGVNGRLVPFTDGPGDADALGGAIVDVLTSGMLEEMRRGSLARAQAYTRPEVQALWERLLRGETEC